MWLAAAIAAEHFVTEFAVIGPCVESSGRNYPFRCHQGISYHSPEALRWSLIAAVGVVVTTDAAIPLDSVPPASNLLAIASTLALLMGIAKFLIHLAQR